jgi:catechol 2,3-dioxygenase-like lactoylglutathione lyase family enzyme
VDPGALLSGRGARRSRSGRRKTQAARAAKRRATMSRKNTEFDIRGVNHLALVCRDMARTVEFYRDVLGMPLVKTIDLPGGMGQHFFFDIGNGDCLAFFWFPNAPAAQPGISSPAKLPTEGMFLSAHGSMNHIAFNVPAERFDEYYERLKAKGIAVTPVLNHDNSPMQVSKAVTGDVFVRSVYFFDPDGVCLEFAAWTKPFEDADVAHDPMTAEGKKAVGKVIATA